MTSKREKPVPDAAENAQGFDPIDEAALESFPASDPKPYRRDCIPVVETHALPRACAAGGSARNNIKLPGVSHVPRVPND
jgi:hypothetical protein